MLSVMYGQRRATIWVCRPSVKYVSYIWYEHIRARAISGSTFRPTSIRDFTGHFEGTDSTGRLPHTLKGSTSYQGTVLLPNIVGIQYILLIVTYI